MKWLNSDVRLLLGSLVMMTLISILTVALRPAPDAPPLSVRSAEAEGALALWMWLEESGYRVREAVNFPDDLEDLDALFILAPILPFEDGERRAIYNWLRQGNTLIVAGDPLIVNTLLTEDFSLRPLSPLYPENIIPSAPTLLIPPFDPLPQQAVFVIETTRNDTVIHLTANGLPALASYNESQGTFWVSGMIIPFTNRGVREPSHARMILNLLATLPRNAVIGFDEGHHGLGRSSQTVLNWLVSTSPGWGVLSGFALTFVFLSLRGRRFGKAVPLPDDRLRREPVEYIQAMANLFRRSGQRGEMLKHYRQQFRRKLSERYGVDTDTSDNELVKIIVYHDSTVDEKRLRDLLARLSQKNVSEAELLAVVRDVDTFLETI
jgi:hypothetical protein